MTFNHWKDGVDSDRIVEAMEQVAEVLWGEHREWDSDTLEWVGEIVGPLVNVHQCERCGYEGLRQDPCDVDLEEAS